jgi:hypothetical protein
MTALISFILSLLVYVGGGCAIVYYSSGQWWELYAIVAWMGFWMAGLRQMALMSRSIIIELAEGIRTAVAGHFGKSNGEG